jgi:probable HAF family extracellular repeat protein
MGFIAHRAHKGFAFAILAALGAAAPARAAVYTVLDLGPLGDPSFQTGQGGGRLNRAGQVVGFFASGGNNTEAFRTAPNSPIDANSDIGGFGGTFGSRAEGINDSGQAVGQASAPGNARPHAFRTDPNANVAPSSDLGALGTVGGASAYVSDARAVNASGQVVGYSDTNQSGIEHAFRTAPNGLITPASDLGTFGGRVTVATGINASGQTVGAGGLAGNNAGHAFRTTATGGLDGNSDLGTLGGSFSAGQGINDSGQVVGYADSAAGARHAIRTAPNGSIDAGSDLGTLGGFLSSANSINSAGQAVGYSYITGNSATHAFFIDVTGAMQDLNSLIPADSGFVLTEANGINDLGQITGYGTINGQTDGFLLTLAPEPARLSLLAVGGMALFRRNRRKRA